MLVGHVVYILITTNAYYCVFCFTLSFPKYPPDPVLADMIFHNGNGYIAERVDQWSGMGRARVLRGMKCPPQPFEIGICYATIFAHKTAVYIHCARWCYIVKLWRGHVSFARQRWNVPAMLSSKNRTLKFDSIVFAAKIFIDPYLSSGRVSWVAFVLSGFSSKANKMGWERGEIVRFGPGRRLNKKKCLWRVAHFVF